MPLCECIGRLSDDVALTRLSGELALLLLTDPAAGGSSGSPPPQLVTAVLEDTVIANILQVRSFVTSL